MVFTIYRVTNDVNNRIYIGFTSLTVEQRWVLHVRDSVRSRGSHLHSAIQKYGAEHFSIEAIYQSDDRDHTHNVMEPYFIKLYDSVNSGYNVQPGGEGGTGKPIKVYQYSRTLDLIKVWDSVKDAAEFIGVASAAISTALRNADQGKASALKGYVWAREGIQPSIKKGSVIVEQLDDNGVVLARYHSYLAAAKAINGTGSGITQGIKHPNQRWYGFYWRAYLPTVLPKT